MAMFHQIHFLTKKGCHRTSLEFCKLILSLSPDDDPLSILFLIDICAIMSKQYKWLINFYKVWNPLKNLHQLPNFAYSVPLAEFLLHDSENSKYDEKQLDKKLQEALIAFPSVLPELLNLCNIDADAKTERNRYFGMSADTNQLTIVTQMCRLYAHRIFHVWKQPEVMKWLERCTKVAIERVKSKDSMVAKSQNNRKSLYKGTPRNVYRHFILSDVKEVPANLPVELQSAPLYSYDPLPPPDTETSYERPPSPTSRSRYPIGNNLLSTFLEALMPLYGVEQEALNQAGVRGIQMENPIEVLGEGIQQVPGDNIAGGPLADVHQLENNDANGGNLGGQGAVANRENLLAMLRNWMQVRNDAPFDLEERANNAENDEEESSEGAIGGLVEDMTQMQMDENLALALAAQSEDDDETGNN